MNESSKEICETKKNITLESYAATKEWIESQQQYNDDCSSCISSTVESSVYDSDDEGGTIDIKPLGIHTASDDIDNIADAFQNALQSLNSTNTIQTVGNVTVENSTGVHIGNTTNINGNIQIICKIGNNSKRNKNKDKEKQISPPQTPKCFSNSEEDNTERVNPAAFINRPKFKRPKNLCDIVPRHSWLAQSPMEKYNYLTEPVPYVIVAHTATESSEVRAINVRIVRDVQCFHIESRGWNDIGYNFLVGCDGNSYEGRGWGVVGAHTLGYNFCSIGISFIGCFMRELPTKAAFTAFKNLLQKGVDEGHIAKDYKLVTHSQCYSTESPGRKLIEELETWDHFYRLEDEDEE